MGDPAGPGSDPEQIVFGSHPGDPAMSRKSNDKPKLPPWEGHLGGAGSQLK